MSVSDHAMGAAYGALLALTLGQLGPQIGTPEEVITMPAGAVIGGVVGAKSIEHFFKGLF